MKIAWIGTGVMGKAMLSHLLDKHELHVYNRTFEKMDDIPTPYKYQSIKECVKDCDVVITMVGYPEDVKDVYFNDGILSHAKKHAILIDMTTSSPDLAIEINAHSKHFEVLDAPVSGGDTGAKNATLSIMVGGNKETYEKAYPLFQLMGTNINWIGSHGAGQHCKMCNQIAVAGATAAMSEALVYMKEYQLDADTVLKAIGSGAAQSWQLTNMAPRVLKKDFDPGFFIKHFTKDMRIAKAELEKVGIHLEMLNTVYEMYVTLENEGYGNDGTQALIKYYSERK
ncbi:3-hydroxyisobutyrate dehydrogenase [Breznakia sp. PF5-3]|uniref:NAD(P)-dependent oxidoreductase n=1 Tax=unclassified Breznakia TaxID=2623764 RepID=UPI002405550D|nr:MULTISPECIES: NAD(P)-dependent oxidoreductase [unclassified Breznakia]MDL2276101.1 NAD(P)-dependent oxidoreductase [Breznakia sp. OttesenSCG-928-G09]MDF9823875.1 3-hydroxyisobutyrate dehydrogenase [Breznakia sp. PM6-1]MDF9834674.1 3-hydroxyisobutyrate dehydrogenase [Breznakia sp. PF5-3]MDF9836891.1 3-hydroxyisobutyrate dehydrogenase [Breznakia sp. PFB2-8]MDF9858908.1 3-hydroxyisobutyrate dehydrogenase [Breznakia sp. PH5-24]